MAHIVGSVEDAHVARDAHKHILGDVDLHEDEKLVQGAEYVPHAAQVDPLGAVNTKQVLNGALLVLSVDDEVAGRYGEDRNDSKDEVAQEEELELRFGEILVEAQSVARHEWQV